MSKDNNLFLLKNRCSKVYRFLWSSGQIYFEAAEVSPEFNLLNVYFMFLSLESHETNSNEINAR